PVKRCPPHSDSGCAGKVRLNFMAFAMKTNSAELVTNRFRYLNADPLGRSAGVGQQPLSTRFVDWRRVPVRHDYPHPMLPQRNGGGQSGRPAADHEHIGFEHALSASELKPVPIPYR